jgi:Ribonuclease toxin, BrnT, of type II toxin-antitoxin system
MGLGEERAVPSGTWIWLYGRSAGIRRSGSPYRAGFDYGEPRYRLFGRVNGRLYVIVFTYRGEFCRIVSARKANTRERQSHDTRSDGR